MVWPWINLEKIPNISATVPFHYKASSQVPESTLCFRNFSAASQTRKYPILLYSFQPHLVREEWLLWSETSVRSQKSGNCALWSLSGWWEASLIFFSTLGSTVKAVWVCSRGRGGRRSLEKQQCSYRPGSLGKSQTTNIPTFHAGRTPRDFFKIQISKVSSTCQPAILCSWKAKSLSTPPTCLGLITLFKFIDLWKTDIISIILCLTHVETGSNGSSE